jgi:hypothetical protein
VPLRRNRETNTNLQQFVQYITIKSEETLQKRATYTVCDYKELSQTDYMQKPNVFTQPSQISNADSIKGNIIMGAASVVAATLALFTYVD